MKIKALHFILCVILLMTSCSDSLEDRIKRQIQTMEGMSQLGTVEYTITKIIKLDDTAIYKFGDRKILFSCRAYMKAGIDLVEFSSDNITIDKTNNAINVVLPKPQVLSFNMPLEEIKLEYESIGFFRSNFTAEDRNYFLQQGEADILKDVNQFGIFTDAEQNAKMFFEALFAQLGFETINVEFK